MIQPAMHACRTRPWQTFSVVLAAAVALLLPGFVAFFAAAGHDTATAWLEDYHPVVYFTATADAEQVEAVRAEISSWQSVGEVRLRRGADAVKDLERRLGAERVRELGVTSNMLPMSIVVVPSTPVAGHIDLVSRVAGLEVREEIDAVNIPDAMAMRVLLVLSVLGILGCILGVLGLVIQTIVLGEYLARLQRFEQAQNDVLLMFGAHGRSVRNPTIVRGGMLGLWSGGLATVTLLTALAIWQAVASASFGSSAGLVSAWPVAMLPLVVGSLMGLSIGSWISAPGRRPTALVPRLLTAYGV